MSTEASNQGWPDYFNVHTAGQDSQQPGMPTALVDVFYLQPNGRETALIGVAGDSEGALQTTVGDAVDPSFGPLADQIEALRVGQRDTFRGIAAPRVGVMAMEAISQDFATRGFNDPVTLYGQLAVTTARGPEYSNASRKGTMSVGRLDLLMAYREGLAHRFRSVDPNNANAFMVPFLLAPNSRQRSSSELVVAYPAFGPTTYEFGDNTAIARHIVYDLLLSVQKDLVEEGIDHPFIHERVPVPNRQRLDSELTLDGYEICGNEAVKTGQSSNDRKGLIAHLRAFTRDWSADRIALPPEATDDDYIRIIDGLLPYIQTSLDREAAAAVSRLVTPRVVGRATLAQPNILSSSPIGTAGNQSPQTQRQQPVVRPSVPQSRPAPTPPSRPDYSKLFQDSRPDQSEAARRAAARKQWEGMFDVDRIQVRNTPNTAQHPSAQTAAVELKNRWSGIFDVQPTPAQGTQAQAAGNKWDHIFSDGATDEQPASTSKWGHVFSDSSEGSSQTENSSNTSPDKKSGEEGGDWLRAYQK